MSSATSEQWFPASRHRRRLAGAAALVTALVWVAVACGGSPGGGDPGNRRLQALSRDPVFAARAPGATDVVVKHSKAYYVTPGFNGGGWHGPSVVVTFRSAAPPRNVFSYYERAAAAAAWHATKRNVLGLPNTWAKTYPGKVPATLLLLQLGRGKYMLSGSTPTVG